MQTNRIFVLLCLIIAAFSDIFAQQDFYSRYEGRINNEVAVINMVQLNSKLRAHLQFMHDASDSHAILTGIIDNQGDFFLKRELESDTLIRGRMTSEHLEGFFFTASGEMQRIAFTSSDSKNSITLTPYHLSVDKKLFEKRQESPIALFESELIVPQDEAFRQLSDSLLSHAFLAGNQTDTFLQPMKILQQQADTFFFNYQKMSSYDSLPSQAMQWIKSEEVGVVMNNNELLCIETSDYVYSGGAHGMLNRLFYVFDTRNGKKLTLEDIFRPQADSTLKVLLTEALRSRYEIDQDVSLKSFGLFVEVIEPNTNFWLSNTGIGFYYNSYELAPYSFGQSNLFLPFSQLNDLLNETFWKKLLLKE